MNIGVTQSDVLEWLKTLPNEYANAIFCDPPYGLDFMGKQWDHGVPSVDVWREALRVCKPGAVLMAFGGTRTEHRLVCSIEDAGWEIYDKMMWVYGSGFPKSHDISKAIDKAVGAERDVIGASPYNSRRPNPPISERYKQGGWPSDITAPSTPDAITWDGYGTALKPAYEPIVIARKPRTGTYAKMAVDYGTGALWIEGCRVGTEQTVTDGRRKGIDNSLEWSKTTSRDGWQWKTNASRWPANLIHDDSEEVLTLFPITGASKAAVRRNGKFKSVAKGHETPHTTYGHNDNGGSAARFFYTAKASRNEREAGLEMLPLRNGHLASSEGGGGGRKADAEDNPNIPRHNHHPTVKPLSVCEYLARLIVPPQSYRDDAVLLVPYSGSGSEMIGAMQAGWLNIQGCELEAEYIEIAQKRITYWQGRERA